MACPHASLQRGDQRLAFVRSSLQRQIGQHFGPLFPICQGLQNGAPGFAHQVRKDRTELDVGLLQQLVDAVDVPGALLLETAAVAGQVAQVPLRLRGDEGGLEQTVLRTASAIHSASLVSVFLPGTAFICWALTSTNSKSPSIRLKRGFQ